MQRTEGAAPEAMKDSRIQFSPVEITLVVVLLTSLLLAFLQARREEARRQQ